MKKNTINFFVVMFLLSSLMSFAQTLNQNAGWPNAAWSVTGTYDTDPTAFEADPTATSNFAFDDDDAGSGSDDSIAAESPIIDLTAAHTAGETWLTIGGDYVYRYLANDELKFQYWDADASAWTDWGFGFNASTTGAPTNDYCSVTAEAYTSSVLNIVSFTSTQLSGFRYRISYDDDPAGADYNYGFCFQSPTITSATPPSCPDPSVLMASNIDAFSADLSWSENGSATAWNIELVDITASGTATGTPTSTGVANPFNLTGLTPSNDYEFYVQADCGGDGTSNWVGPFAFSTEVACPDPTVLTATNIATTTADLGWTAGASETMWNIEIVDITAGGTASGTPTASGVGNPYTATGLVDNNDYEFYVQADCNPNGTSTWVGPFAFRTACNTLTAPYTEDFENGGDIPNCWSSSSSTSREWDYATSPTFGNSYSDNTSGSGYFAFVDASTTTVTSDATLTTPLIDVSGLTSPSLEFYVHHFVAGGSNSNTITVDVYDGAAWNNVYTDNNGDVDGWEKITVNLSSLTITGDIQARFIVDTETNSNYENDIAIDDVSFQEAPSCFLPSTLNVANIADTTADLSWIENGTATVWDIEVVDITAGGTATGTPTTTGVTTNPYTATGLVANNDYEFYVRADCGGDGTSTWVGPFSFRTACAVFTAPWSEPFATNSLPNCWSESGDNTWEYGSTNGTTPAGFADYGASNVADHTTGGGGTFIGMDGSDNGNGESSVLLSPLVDVSGLTTPQLNYWVFSNNVDDAALNILQVEVYDGAAWNVVNTVQANLGANWMEYTTDLSTLTITGDVQLRFTITGDNSAGGFTFNHDILLDDISLREAPLCTQAVVNSSVINEDCANGQFYVDVDVTTVGDGTQINDGTSTFAISGVGVVQVGPYASGASVTLTLEHSDAACDFGLGSFSYTCPPANNDCADAIALTPGAVFADNPIVGTNVGATDSGELAPGCASYQGGDAWYSVVVPSDGMITLEVNTQTGGVSDTGGAAYSGSCGSLTLIECNDDGSTNGSHPIINVNDIALANQTIYFRVWEYGNNATGEFQVSAYSATLSNLSFENAAAFTYYPNPVQNTLTLNAQNSIENVAMYNMLGQEVLRATPNTVNSELDMSSLQDGTYFVKVTIAGVTKTIRVIKQ
jgi:hypothetical protein